MTVADLAVRAEEISKRYAIGERVRYDTLRDAIMRGFRRQEGRGSRNGGAQEHWALRDVTFDVARGEVIGIIGRNGAGKSTLLKVLSRITEPTMGRAEIRGRVASLLEVGTGFHPELTGRENVFLNGAILGMRRTEINEKFDAIVGFAEVEKFIDTPVKHYSSGMYLRLAFAVAAHLESEILVVDEVLAVGDQAFQQRCLGKLGEAASSGRTVLLVSHNMAAVEGLCERALLIGDGRVVADGPADAVVRRYTSLASAGLAESLSDRTDRAGNGDLRFTGLRIHAGRDEFATLYSGCDAVIALDYEAREESKRVQVAITVLDQHDRVLFACDNEQAASAVAIGKAGTLSCRIPELPLAPGTYRVTVWAAVGGTVADYVRYAGEFTVSPADYFGSGRLPDHPKFGPFLVRHRWTDA